MGPRPQDNQGNFPKTPVKAQSGTTRALPVTDKPAQWSIARLGLHMLLKPLEEVTMYFRDDDFFLIEALTSAARFSDSVRAVRSAASDARVDASNGIANTRIGVFVLDSPPRRNRTAKRPPEPLR